MSRNFRNYLVTGGMGFIGSNFIKFLMTNTNSNVINIDNLSIGSSKENLSDICDEERYTFYEISIDDDLIFDLMKKHKIDCVVHFAAESHVDRSLIDPFNFINTNIMGTYKLLTYVKRVHDLGEEIHFHHVSTDEVFGSLGPEDPPFTEKNIYLPNSPYSASKASSDHLVRAWNHSFGINVTTSNCSNNYGPSQYPEKLIPVIINSCLREREIPIYGDGKNIRDWLYVEDHCKAIFEILINGRVGETYNIGGKNEISNNEIAQTICNLLEGFVDLNDFSPLTKKEFSCKSFTDLIKYVEDRKGHDFRYSINPQKIEYELNWFPSENFESGISKTIQWYLDNLDIFMRIND
tara:strand:- start:1458 stop:2507 length:1050 start_codon:yes stop_codon:yes gene_type:complete